VVSLGPRGFAAGRSSSDAASANSASLCTEEIDIDAKDSDEKVEAGSVMGAFSGGAEVDAAASEDNLAASLPLSVVFWGSDVAVWESDVPGAPTEAEDMLFCSSAWGGMVVPVVLVVSCSNPHNCPSPERDLLLFAAVMSQSPFQESWRSGDVSPIDRHLETLAAADAGDRMGLAAFARICE
jgi:hypothetical protein